MVMYEKLEIHAAPLQNLLGVFTFDARNAMIKHGLGRLNLTGLSGFLRLIRDPDPVHVFAHSLPRGLTAGLIRIAPCELKHILIQERITAFNEDLTELLWTCICLLVNLTDRGALHSVEAYRFV